VVPDRHLAQVNVAFPLAPLDSELLRDFVSQLAPVNEAADASPGFVWRPQTEDGDATAIRAFGDDRLLVNMSVWESLEALRAFVYRSPAHVGVMRRRREWFDRIGTYLALWWVTAGHRPTVAEAEKRLTLLQAVGPSPDAFTFAHHFAEPGGGLEAVDDDRWLCPAG